MTVLWNRLIRLSNRSLMDKRSWRGVAARTCEGGMLFPQRSNMACSRGTTSHDFSTATAVSHDDDDHSSNRDNTTMSVVGGDLSPRIVRDGSAVCISFVPDKQQQHEQVVESLFHAPWLWYNDPTFIHPSSGQRLRRLSQYPGWKISRVERVDLDSALKHQGGGGGGGGGENKTTTTATTTTTSMERSNAKQKSCIIPNPPPPPGCLHSIGTVYQTFHSKNDDGAPFSTTELLKVTWDTRPPATDAADDATNSSSSSSSNNNVVSYYDWNWLKRCRYDDTARQERAQKTQITPLNALGRHARCPSILQVNYFDLFPSNTASSSNDYEAANKDTLFQVLHSIAEQGAVLIRNAPLGSLLDYKEEPENNARGAGTADDEQTAAVAKVGRALGGGTLSHGALYGNLFHVRSVPNAINIAYTSAACSPHQDLAYYESKPGLQLLHCIRNRQDKIRGGESTLIDAVAAAEHLKQLGPDYFETLCRCFGTFLKQREGADMVYSRPHIVVGEMGQVVAVHWSPPFEGPPMGIPQDQMEDYFVAYAAFERMLDDHACLSDNDNNNSSASSALLPPDLDAALHQYARDYTWERLLEPGDMLVFNNQRMLHGRRSFALLKEEKDGGDDGSALSNHTKRSTVHRHLAGCYTNIDDTINTYRTLLRELPDRGNRMVRGFGNASPGSL